ncbi:MAG: hypothetical protein K9G33_10420 [Sneathiella sp.]|nr:hypothetical protein [Sneathiella sp.]
MTAQTSSNLGKDFERAAMNSRPAKPKGLSPISLRLSAQERSRLQYDAGNQSISAYIRSRLFGDEVAPRRRRQRPVQDHEALARVLAAFGQSGIAPSFARIAKAADTGTLETGPELRAQLEAACAEIAAIRHDLIRALGLSPE